jgi:hypothetical protein
MRLIGVAIILAPWLLYGETLTLQQAIVAAEANNRVIRAARLEHDKALREIGVARTYRLPIFSVSALGSQSLAHLGLTFPMGSFGVYPGIGPVSGKTTTLTGPLQPAGIFYSSHSPCRSSARLGSASNWPAFRVVDSDGDEPL